MGLFRRSSGESEQAMKEQDLVNKLSKFLLTISAEAYVDSIGRNLSQYNFQGVDNAQENSFNWVDCKKSIYEQARQLDADVVTDLRLASAAGPGFLGIYMNGTALIPKK